jgi:hypothetical protein
LQAAYCLVACEVRRADHDKEDSEDEVCACFNVCKVSSTVCVNEVLLKIEFAQIDKLMSAVFVGRHFFDMRTNLDAAWRDVLDVR